MTEAQVALDSDCEVALLEPRLVTKIQERFWIPAYQRGYRWGPTDVLRLLDDIQASESDDYYLQPIVVKPRADGSWELVDGQQRLTTLYLVLKYLGDRHLPSARPKFKLEYETRADSTDYLDSLRPGPDERDEELSRSNIDYFHMRQAYDALHSWCETQSDATGAAIDLYQALSKRVHVIWYQPPASEDSTDLFTRLNLGRIALTDAELVKASVLSQVRAARPERLIEVAAQWDAVERDLRAPEAWAFVSGRGTGQSSHIDIVLDALAGIERDRITPAYATFERLRPQIEADPIKFWNRVLGVHAQILGWYDDLELFHRLGYLITRGWSLAKLLELGRGQTRTELKNRLRTEITDDLNVSADGLADLTYTSRAASRALLLMNLETAQTAGTRYSFHAHLTESWTLEHIHAQNAEQLITEAQWREWLRLALSALNIIPDPGAQKVAQGIAEDIPPLEVSMKRAAFEALEARALAAFEAFGQEAVADVDGIENLALLSGSVNTALSNSTFAVKREQLLVRDRAGQYIPPCTRNVFLKYYTLAGDQQLHVWSGVDREHYLAEMTRVLTPYLRDERADDE